MGLSDVQVAYDNRKAVTPYAQQANGECLKVVGKDSGYETGAVARVPEPGGEQR